MTIRKKTLITITVTLLMLLTVLILAANIVILGGFEELELKEVHSNTERGLAKIKELLSGLSSVAGDWAPWNDSYFFMQDFNRKYLENNLNDSTIANLGINFMLFADITGRMVHAKHIDIKKVKEVPLPEGLWQSIRVFPSLIFHERIDSESAGIVMYKDIPVLIASHPILKSDHSGPILGSMIVGRYLDNALTEKISRALLFKLMVHPVTAGDLRQDVYNMKSELLSSESIAVVKNDPGLISGYAMVSDFGGQPGFILQAQVTRNIYRHGVKTLIYYIFSLLAVGGIFCLIAVLLLERNILAPLSILSSNVIELGTSDKSNTLLPVYRDDELGSLAREINALMKRIKEKTDLLEEANLRLNNDIENLIKAEEEKNRLKEQLQRSQKMEALGLLAGGVAHDLNNVLSGIVSYPELLLLELPADSPLKKAVETIKKSGEKAAEIVQDLLTLARRGVRHSEVLNLNDIIIEYQKSPEYERLVTYHPNVRILTFLEGNLLNMLGSSIHLKKSIMNLLSNAAEAQPDGGEITITTENIYVDRPIKGYENISEGDYVVLGVKDKGIGIHPDDLNRIFEPFYTKKVMGRSGTGLGMAVVWGTVQDHKGYIQVDSAQGKGTAFRLYFQATREEIFKKATSVSLNEYMGNQESILLVDDVKEQREIASHMLKKLEYRVIEAPSGEAAVTYLKEHTVDIVVLDMIMDPGMDGLETYKEIIKDHPGQKAIITSGFSETEKVKELQRLGAGLYVKKPYSLEKIGIAIKKELDKKSPKEVCAIS